MTTLLLAEDLFLLTHDDNSGKAANTTSLDSGLAGALLLDLAAAGRVTIADGDGIVAVDGPVPHPLLAAAFRQIADSGTVRPPGQWVSRLPRELSPLAPTVGRSLVERGVLREEQSKTFGLFKTTTWPTVDPGPETELRGLLQSVLVAGQTPDTRTSHLVALLSALDLVKEVVAKQDRKAAVSRAQAIKESAASSGAVADAVSASVQAVQVAILTAVIVPTVISTSSS